MFKNLGKHITDLNTQNTINYHGTSLVGEMIIEDL